MTVTTASCRTDETLPVTTGELLDVEILRWDPLVDVTALAWKGILSASRSRWPGPSPALDDIGWVALSAPVNEGGAARPRWMLKVPVTGVTPAGRRGVWVRAVGTATSSPVRWAGAVMLV